MKESQIEAKNKVSEKEKGKKIFIAVVLFLTMVFSFFFIESLALRDMRMALSHVIFYSAGIVICMFIVFFFFLREAKSKSSLK